MDVKVVDIQGGKDPADLVRANPEDWKNALRSAKPVIEFELNNVMREVTDPRKAPKVIRDRVLPFVIALESSTDKAYAVKSISEKINLPEQAVWDDVHAVEAKLKAEAGSGGEGHFGARGGRELGAAPAGADAVSRTTVPVSASTRIDLVERRMFGLLDLMEKAQSPKAAAYRAHIEKIAADTYPNRIERIKPIMGDIVFEVETLFGAEQDKWPFHMDDLVFNFERDMINAELLETMAKLRTAEKAGENALVADLAKKCQELSMRKAEIGKAK